jgi:uncharacterized protein YecE (DUF72 family)
MSDNIVSGEVLSFVDLLERHEVEIPIIQRDYAQGRDENKDIRQEFLYALKEIVIGNKKIKLDFIYGEIIDEVFQPLDGQQRLTTLFLLHWYAAVKEEIFSDDFRAKLSKFSYETRFSSRDFCENLVKKAVVVDDSEKLSQSIKNTNWFYLSWKQDPSINAMLNTLDDIQNIFSDVQNLLTRLITDKCVIFHYLNLQDLGLSDDLYIKMNARGKLLTPFENFKAQLQKRIKDEKWEEECIITEKFDYKIDTTWAEFFWSKFGVKIDVAHIRFISTLVMFKLSFGKRELRESADRQKNITQLNNNKDGRYLLHFIDKSGYEYICNCYEVFINAKNTNINLDISEINFFNHYCNDVLGEMAEDSSYTKKVLLFAQIEYLMRNDTFDKIAYLKWMRIVRNFVCFTNITIKKTSSREDLVRAAEAFESMIRLIRILSKGSGDIYAFLANNLQEDHIPSYRKEQLTEEIEKARKIIENPPICDIIWRFEDLSLFRGKISFVLECAKYLLSISSENSTETETIKALFDVFDNYFGDNFDMGLLNRALLTIDVESETQYYDYWISKWYAINAEKRKFIANLTDLYYLIYKEGVDCKYYFMALVLQLLEKNYQQIIDDFVSTDSTPEWKIKLIKESSWMQNRKSDFFAIADSGSQCYLLKSQRPLNSDGGIIVQ